MIDYRLDGDVRFISHQDTLRLFHRALARAGLPVRYSEGFNPHPRVTLPLPRPVGVASDAETAVVELTERIDTEEATRRLAEQMPEGIDIRRGRWLKPGEKLVPDLVRYRLSTGDRPPGDLERRARGLLASEIVEVQRTKPDEGGSRTVDIRPFLADVAATPDGIEVTLRVTGSGTARPTEVAQLLELDDEESHCRIRRTEVIWRQN